MTRVLVVGAWFPYPPRWGWATRVYQLARQLARRHEVTLLTYAAQADRTNIPRLEEQGIHKTEDCCVRARRSWPSNFATSR